MSQLTIYKASAGSGKTFRLVLEYLKLLVENPFNYKHILAVTFTNKATTEMKERILRDLNKVAKGDNQLIGILKVETNFGEQKIIENAQLALSGILHDFDRFAITTIDSFFQKVLRAFARETGLQGTYEVELDQQAVLEEACDRLLLSSEDDLNLRNWLIDMSEHQLGEGRNWQFRDNILSLGNELTKEPFQKLLVNQTDTETERDKLNKLRQQLIKTKKFFEQAIIDYGKKLQKMLSDHQLQPSDFKGGSRSFANYFEYWANFRSNRIEPTATILNLPDNPDDWYTQKSPAKAKIIDCFHGGLNQTLKETLKFIEQHYPEYVSAIEISKNIYALGVLNTLSGKVREVGHEKNALLLSEGNTLLNGIIGNNDAPFIYEKAGNYYNFFMIDEFQDTSVTQWENFRPLIANSLAENHPNLVVGDIKQSIYRWRNSDWQLLDKALKQELTPQKVKDVTLGSNWRSCTNIVEFNNQLFNIAKTLLQNDYNAQIGDKSNDLFDSFKHTIASAYSDVEQTPASGKTDGYIRCTFIDKEDYIQETLNKLVSTIEQVQAHGFSAGDIAILVKKNKQGQQIAEALLKQKKTGSKANFEVISDDTLYIHTSPSVNFITQMMQYIATPFDPVVQANIVYQFSKHLLPYLQKNNMVPPRISDKQQQSIAFENNNNSYNFLPHAFKNEFFPFMNDPSQRNIIQQWSNLSVSDLTETIIKLYNIDKISSEQANIQAFKDVVNDFSKRESGSLHRFIEWWGQNGAGVKLQSAGERDAIRIMSIHKSKGLEFPIVLVPFCDWGFYPDAKKSNILWCPTNETPFKQFPVLPVKYSKTLQKSLFAEQYYTEMLLSAIDNLNVLYVALTRAEQGLYIFSKTNEKENTNTANGLLKQVIEQTKLLEKCGDNNYEKGSYATIKKEKATSNEVVIKGNYARHPKIAQSLRLRKNYDGFLEENSNVLATKINRGKIMHELLSNIESDADVEKAIALMINKGSIDAKEADIFSVEINTLLSNQMATDWFNGSLKVLNEMTILSPGFELSRPDRVMLGKNKTVIVDYKLSDIIDTNHQQQVKRYINLVEKMGYQKPEGYVWYLKTNQIININNWETT